MNSYLNSDCKSLNSEFTEMLPFGEIKCDVFSSSFCWQQWNGYLLAWQKDQFVVHLQYLANISLPYNFDHVVRLCLYDRLWSWCSQNNGETEREKHIDIKEHIQTMLNSFGLYCPSWFPGLLCLPSHIFINAQRDKISQSALSTKGWPYLCSDNLIVH